MSPEILKLIRDLAAEVEYAYEGYAIKPKVLIRAEEVLGQLPGKGVEK